MFTMKNPNVIVSDEGFSVTVLGPTGLKYEQGGIAVRINAESMAHPYGILVYTSSFEGACATLDINEGELRDRIQRSFDFKGVKVDFV